MAPHEETLQRLSKVKVLVLGDLIVDAYLEGTVERISPEAPVPVLEHKKLTHRLGGAANVALNLSSLGIEVSLAGLVGDDDLAAIFRNILSENKISGNCVVADPSRPTSLKTRVIAGHQQLLRIDQERLGDLSESLAESMFGKMASELAHFDAIIISDYGKGVIHAGTFARLQKLLAGKKIVSVLDPKKKNFSIYKGVVDTMTHNHHEASDDSGLPCDSDAEVCLAGPRLIEKHSLKSTLITRGAKGMALFTREGECHLIPSFARSVFDVSGAGDTVIAVFAAARAAGADLKTAAILANHAAGVVVSKFGTATLTMDELREEIRSREKS